MILGSAIVLGTVTLGLALQGGVAGIRRAAPALACASAAAGLTAFWVLFPYLATSGTWSLAKASEAYFAFPWSISPGGNAFPGFLLTGACLVALAEYFRRPASERPGDPRLVYLLAAFLAWWSSIYSVPLGFGLSLPSPLLLLGDVLPGLDSVRAPSAVGMAKGIPLAIIASFGFAALLRRVPASTVFPCILLLAVGIAAQRLHGPTAGITRGNSNATVAADLGPSPAVIDLLAKTEGPTAVVPGGKNLASTSEGIMWSAWTGHPVSSCYNSLATPIGQQVADLADGPARMANFRALAALGFRDLIINRERLPEEWQERRGLRPRDMARTGLELRGQAGMLDFYSLPSADETTSDWQVLVPSPYPLPLEVVAGSGPAEVTLTTRNRSSRTFIAPRPFKPMAWTARWYNRKTRAVSKFNLQAFPVLAVPSHGPSRLEIEVPTDVAPGNYRLELIPAGTRHRIAMQIVNVRQPEIDQLASAP